MFLKQITHTITWCVCVHISQMRYMDKFVHLKWNTEYRIAYSNNQSHCLPYYRVIIRIAIDVICSDTKKNFKFGHMISFIYASTSLWSGANNTIFSHNFLQKVKCNSINFKILFALFTFLSLSSRFLVSLLFSVFSLPFVKYLLQFDQICLVLDSTMLSIFPKGSHIHDI